MEDVATYATASFELCRCSEERKCSCMTQEHNEHFIDFPRARAKKDETRAGAPAGGWGNLCTALFLVQCTQRPMVKVANNKSRIASKLCGCLPKDTPGLDVGSDVD